MGYHPTHDRPTDRRVGQGAGDERGDERWEERGGQHGRTPGRRARFARYPAGLTGATTFTSRCISAAGSIVFWFVRIAIVIPGWTR